MHQAALTGVPPNPRTRGILPQAQKFVPETDQSQDLWPRLIKAVVRIESIYNPSGTQALTQLKLGKPQNWQCVNFYENMWTAPRYLGRLLTKIGDLSPLAAALSPSFQWTEHHRGPLLHEAQASVREARRSFLNYAQAQSSEWGQRLQGSNQLPEPNHLGYSFPVAYPFSFRDSWGDWRSGGRSHRAVDIFAGEGAPVYAVTSGVIRTLAIYREAGITLLLLGQDHKAYEYMHLQGYAEGIAEGKAVRSGELIGYVGRTGVKQSAAHLHLQVYADHRLCKDELLNPYDFLVRLCQGIGVTDLYHPKIARLHEGSELQVSNIQVARRPAPAAFRGPGSQLRVKDSSILVINNF